MTGEETKCIDFILRLIEVIRGGEPNKIDLQYYYSRCKCLPEMLSSSLKYLRKYMNIVLVVDEKVDTETYVSIDITNKVLNGEINLGDLFKIKIVFCRSTEGSKEDHHSQFVYYPIISINGRLINLGSESKFYFKDFTKFIPCKYEELKSNKDIFRNAKVFLIRKLKS